MAKNVSSFLISSIKSHNMNRVDIDSNEDDSSEWSSRSEDEASIASQEEDLSSRSEDDVSIASQED